MYKIRITETAIGQLKAFDKGTQTAIIRKIEELQTSPDSRGKALQGTLSGYRSLRAAGQRYRIIYKVEKAQVIVVVLTIGIRKDGDKKDIYALMKKLVATGLLE